ncbi:hypothetical protein DESA109040_03485 [Deinococcus saxicola]|uniref:hypothetical protein n=1 Tax=Deinococcus saxicola TaxID=249406 RepID=UPI0039F0477D
MPLRQLLFSFNGEGISDYRFLIKVLDRLIPDIAYKLGKDVDILPIASSSNPKGMGFTEKMNAIYEESKGVHAILVHMDADSATEKQVLQNKWTPFIESFSGDMTWIPIIPVKNLESWMLCDVAAIAEILYIEESDARNIMNGRQPENISDGKTLIEEMKELADMDIAADYLHDLLAQSISIQRLDTLDSFRTFRDRMTTAITNLLQ